MKKILLFAFLIFQLSGYSTHYYVSSAGNDGFAGAQGSPWLTLYKATTTAVLTGDTIHIEPGTITETNLCQLSPGVSVRGSGKAVTTIVCLYASNMTLNVSSASVLAGNQAISDITFDGSNYTGFMAISVNRRSNVHVRDCNFVRFSQKAAEFIAGTPGATYAANCSFTGNTVVDCSPFVEGSYPGQIYLTSQDDFICENNSFTSVPRSGSYAGFCVKTNYTSGLKIRNNTINVRQNDDALKWAFAIELWHTSDGAEIANNRIRGIIDVVDGSAGASAYSLRIHNNIIGHDTLQAFVRLGVVLENSTGLSGVIIDSNEFRNLLSPLTIYTVPTSNFQSITIRRNTLKGSGYTGNNYYGFILNSSGNSGFTINNLVIQNNTFISDRGLNYLPGISLPGNGTVTNVSIDNNIFNGYGGSVITSTSTGGSISTVLIRNNCLISNGNSNNPSWGTVTPSQLTVTGSIKLDPLLDALLRPQIGSPVINAGYANGLPYYGSAIDIGAFESMFEVQSYKRALSIGGLKAVIGTKAITE